MITVRDIEQFLYDWAPPETAESWDNVGLLVGRAGPPGPRGGGGFPPPNPPPPQS